MTDADRPQFARNLALLSQTYNEPMSELRAEGYWIALSDLPLEQFNAACVNAMRELKFFPKPSELRERAQGGGEDGAELAWHDYKRLAQRVGGYNSPQLESALAETITLVFGGWQQACWIELSPEMWASKHKEFLRTYRLLKQRGTTGTQRMLGFHDEHNQGKGYLPDEAPVRGLLE